MCQVHSDPRDVNIFIAPDRSRAVLIDWEYVGAGDGYLDLAMFAASSDMDEAEEELLIAAYAGAPDPHALAIVRVYRSLCMVREALWGVLASRLTFLDDFDHLTYTRQSLQRLDQTVESDTFRASLALLEDAR